jgi:hypothetical protein
MGPKPIKSYYPAVNPLPKTVMVRPYVRRDGTVVQPYLRKPKFRTGVTTGYKF